MRPAGSPGHQLVAGFAAGSDRLPRQASGHRVPTTGRSLGSPSHIEQGLAPPVGLEPTTRCLEGSRSIHLSYGGWRRITLLVPVRQPPCQTLSGRNANRGPGDGTPNWMASAYVSSARLARPVVAVAQVVRASGCGPEGRGFKSPRSPHVRALRC
jgi:hypothetical protein